MNEALARALARVAFAKRVGSLGSLVERRRDLVRAAAAEWEASRSGADVATVAANRFLRKLDRIEDEITVWKDQS